MNKTPAVPTGLMPWLLVLGLGVPVALPAQCTNPWPLVPGSTGVEGVVSDLQLVDPDGPGPLGERVAVAGYFPVAGSALATNLALYDPATRSWSAFGAGPFPSNLLLARAINGDLYAAGTFASIGGVAAANVARWDGTSWSALGAGVTGSIFDLVALPTGGIAVCGTISAAGGVPTTGIARWDGSAWSSLQSTALGTPGPGGVTVRAVVGQANGDVLAAVQQFSATSAFYGVLRFDGVAWSPVGGDFGSVPQALQVLPNGDLVAAGHSIQGSATDRVARWTGSAWVALPSVPLQAVYRLATLPTGQLVAAGRRDYTNEVGVAVWDGLLWNLLGTAPYTTNVVTSLCALPTGELLHGGSFWAFGGAATRSLARWNGTAWSATSPGLVGSTTRLVVRPDGSLFAGSLYSGPGTGAVQRWNGSAWSSIGGGFASGGSSDNLYMLLARADGSLVTGGQTGFSSQPTPIVQQWSGTAWTTLATATSGTVRAATEWSNGDLVVGGQFTLLSGVAATNVARFDGSTWSPLGNGLGQPVIGLATAPSGDLFAATTSSVFRWLGSSWGQVGLAQGANRAFAIGGDGSLYLAGDFPAGEVLRWNGAAWTALGALPGGPVASLVVLPNGDVVAGPFVDSSHPPRPLQRWNGSAWAPLGGAVDGSVLTLAVAYNGDVLLGGDFTIADGVARPRFARISTSCPAGVQSLPAGCWQAPQLVATVLPWLGGTCRSMATNLPASSLAIGAIGVGAAAVPLQTLLPQALAGCTLLVAPDVLTVGVPVAGHATQSFVVPNAATLLGTTVRQQVLPFTFDGSGALLVVRATNALVFQIGSF